MGISGLTVRSLGGALASTIPLLIRRGLNGFIPIIVEHRSFISSRIFLAEQSRATINLDEKATVVISPVERSRVIR